MQITFFLNYLRVSCQQDAPSFPILWCIFSINKNILQIHNNQEFHITIIIEKFKIIHYFYLILIRLDTHSSFIKCSIISFIVKKKKNPHQITHYIQSLCRFNCLCPGAVPVTSLTSVTLILLKLLVGLGLQPCSWLVQLPSLTLATPWTVARQSLLSMGFHRTEWVAIGQLFL